MPNEAYLKRHRVWQKHAEKELTAGRKPTKFKDFELEATYFRGINKQTTESQLKRSGLTEEEIARFQRKPIERTIKEKLQPRTAQPKKHITLRRSK